MTSSFELLYETREPIGFEEQTSIKGGVGTPVVEPGLTPAQLHQLFNYAGLVPTETGAQAQIDGFNSAVGQTWNLMVENMYSTPLGKDVINQLLAKTAPGANGAPSANQLNLQDVNPSGPNPGFAAYTPGSHTLKIGGFDNFVNIVLHPDKFTDPTYSVGFLMDAAVHELFHGFEDIVKNNVTSPTGGAITGELQAYIFSSMVLSQFDAKTNSTAIGDPFSEPNTLNMTKNTNPTWLGYYNDIVQNKNFTLADYNNLIQGFKGTIVGANYSQMTSQPVSSLTSSDLYALFIADYQSAPAPTTPTIPGNPSVTEWYNPKTGFFEDTTIGGSPDPGFDTFVRSSDAQITQAAAAVPVNLPQLGTTSLKQAVKAAVIAATNVELGGGTPAAIQQAAKTAAAAILSALQSNPSGGVISTPSLYYGINPYTDQGSIISSSEQNGVYTVIYKDDTSNLYTSPQVADNTPSLGNGVSQWQNPANGSIAYVASGQEIPTGYTEYKGSVAGSTDSGVQNAADNAKDAAEAAGMSPEAQNAAYNAAAIVYQNGEGSDVPAGHLADIAAAVANSAAILQTQDAAAAAAYYNSGGSGEEIEFDFGGDDYEDYGDEGGFFE